MMIQVDPQNYAKIRPFFVEVMFDMFVTAVLNGEMNGRVFVDSIDEPTSGFIMTPESSLACGSPDNSSFLNALRRHFEKTVFIGDLVNPDNPEFAIGYVSGDWDEALSHLMAGWRHVAEEDGDTCHYLLKKLSFPWRKYIPKGYVVAPIDTAELHNQALLLWAKEFDLAQLNTSSDFATFDKEGFGFVTLKDKQVVSACMTDVVSGNRCEIGIVTAESQRRRGLASITAAATVEYALAQGMVEVNWQTGDDNWGSRKTAEKVGFELNLLFPCRYFEPYNR